MDFNLVSEKDSVVTVSDIDIFDMDEIFCCGQCFRWEKQEDMSYTAVAHGKLLRVKRAGRNILLYGTNIDEFYTIWKDYFDLNRSYSRMKELFADDPILSRAMEYAPGIRVLNQEPWETLCTFILSQNNNIKRITGLVKRLCENFGEEVDGGFTFPAPEALSTLSVEDLSPVRAGFRAKYIIDAAKKVAGGEVDLEKIKSLPTELARDELTKIYGVGRKVADCTLLFGFKRAEVMPMDVWMKRVMAEFYPGGFPPEYAQFAGIAQQYLFHYARHMSVGKE